MVRHGTLNSLMKSLAWLTLSNASRAETNTVLLRCVKQLVVCCIAKTAPTSEAFFKKPDCKGRLCKIESSLFIFKYFHVDPRGTPTFKRHYIQCLHLQYTTLQQNYFDILHSWCVTTVCDRQMSVRKYVKEPVVRGSFVRKGSCLRGHLSGERLSGGALVRGSFVRTLPSTYLDDTWMIQVY